MCCYFAYHWCGCGANLGRRGRPENLLGLQAPHLPHAAPPLDLQLAQDTAVAFWEVAAALSAETEQAVEAAAHIQHLWSYHRRHATAHVSLLIGTYMCVRSAKRPER